MAIGPGDVLAGGGRVERPTRFGRELFAQSLHLAAAECVDQIAGEDDASCLLLRKSALNELRGPAVHGVAYLGAEASLAEGHRLPCDGLPVEPGRAAGRHLGFNGKIGADSERHPPPCTSSDSPCVGGAWSLYVMTVYRSIARGCLGRFGA